MWDSLVTTAITGEFSYQLISYSFTEEATVIIAPITPRHSSNPQHQSAVGAKTFVLLKLAHVWISFWT